MESTRRVLQNASPTKIDAAEADFHPLRIDAGNTTADAGCDGSRITVITDNAKKR